MAPPPVSPSVCRASLSQIDTLITAAEGLEADAGQLDDPARRRATLEPAAENIAQAVQLLALNPSCGFFTAEQHLTELKARLAAQRDDCRTAGTLLAGIRVPFLVGTTYYFHALCRSTEANRESGITAADVYAAAAAAVDHAGQMPAYWASRAWSLYAGSLQKLGGPEHAAADVAAPLPPDVIPALEQAVALDPDNLQGLLDLASAKLPEGDRFEIAALVERASWHTPRTARQLWQFLNLTSTLARLTGDGEDTLTEVIQTAPLEMLLAETRYFVSTLTDSDPETARAALHGVQETIMRTIHARLDTLVAEQEFIGAVDLYRRTAAVLSLHPLLEDANFALQNHFFRAVVAGESVTLPDARALCGTTPVDPLLLLILAYAHTAEPDTAATARQGVNLIESAWKQQARIAPSLRPLFAQVRVALHTRFLQHTGKPPRALAAARGLLPSLDATAQQVLDSAIPARDAQGIALAAHYRATVFAITRDPAYTQTALQAADAVHAVMEQRRVESAAGDTDITSPLQLTTAATWTALVDLYHRHNRVLDAGQIYVAGLALASTDARVAMQTHFFHTIVERPEFQKEDMDHPTKDLADQLWQGNSDDPVLRYLHVRSSRFFLMAQDNPWTTSTLATLSENQTTFERLWDNPLSVPTALREPFGIERSWQLYYRAKATWQQLHARENTIDLLQQAIRTADDLKRDFPQNPKIDFPQLWGFYWLGKVTGDLRHYDAALATIDGLERHTGPTSVIAQLSPVKQHELLRNKGWCWFKKMAPVLREERNYVKAAQMIKQHLLPILRQLAALNSGGMEAKRDELSMQYGTYLYYADALDHERMQRWALLPLKETIPPAEVSDDNLQLANAYRQKVLAVLQEQENIGYSKSEIARSRACVLLRTGLAGAQAAKPMTYHLLTTTPAPGTDAEMYADNLQAARECHVMALRLESHLPNLLPETRLANLIWVVKLANDEVQHEPGNPALPRALTLYMDELSELRDSLPDNEVRKIHDLAQTDPGLGSARDEVMGIYRRRGLRIVLNVPNCTTCPPAEPPK